MGRVEGAALRSVKNKEIKKRSGGYLPIDALFSCPPAPPPQKKKKHCKQQKFFSAFSLFLFFSLYKLVLVNPLWIITSALAGYTSVAARSLLLLLGVFTTLLCLWPADHLVMASPSPESLKRPFQLETDFILRPLDLRCLVVEAAAEPMERTQGTGKRRGDGEEAGVAAAAGAKTETGLLRVVAAVPAAPLLCCPQMRRRFREKVLVVDEE